MFSTSVSVKCVIFSAGLNAGFRPLPVIISLETDSENSVNIFSCFDNADVGDTDFSSANIAVISEMTPDDREHRHKGHKGRDRSF